MFSCTLLLHLAAAFSVVHGANLGQWGPLIDFPLVPVAAALLPESGELLLWSAYSDSTFEIGYEGQTKTVIYNPATGNVSQYTITNTGHDMFCPGISVDFNGRVVVTGGDTAPRTSIYDSVAGDWVSGPDMQIPRGYQASATLSDGRIFTIGGSWSGAEGGKNGEAYDPSTNTWTLLPGCLVKPMLTADAQGIFRSDNHGWLFGWKNGYVFQGGPSKAMNWYGTSGNGSQTSAGTRGNDADAMTGDAVMYDAVTGKILAVGGSPSYQYSSATANAHIITIGTPGVAASVQSLNNMHSARAFANAVVLPDGTVCITGGQSYAIPWTDSNSSLTPEIWDPSTGLFTQMTSNTTPRNYHSVALLMPDGTIFSGGGGLCGTCTTNHFDGQFFSPPYLFLSDGETLATRPVITLATSSTNTTTVRIGENIYATTTTAVANFSMIRTGSTTHTVNTDQRRIALTSSIVSGFTYSMQVPGDAGVALPGYWMLFALSSTGVPSVAATILITT